MQFEKPDDEEPLIENGSTFELPVWFRWATSTLALALIVPSTIFIIRYSLDPERFVSPSDLGVVQLILSGTLLLLFAMAPWKTLGLRIRKVGFLEFDRVISGQAAEHAQEMAELRTRIDEMESTVRGLNEIASITESFEDAELVPLLTKFLKQHRPTAYSPLRIRDWGSRQPGYEKLADAKLTSIRRVLQKLVAEGKVVTRVSRMGSTLYKIED